MSKPGRYENLYTQQISEAVFDQTGYEKKKDEEKKKVQAENAAMKRHFKLFGWLIFASFLGVCGYLINLDPDNAGPCAVALGVFLIISVVIWAMNR